MLNKQVVYISDTEFLERFKRAQELVRQNGLDILLINSNEADFANVRYFSDYWPIFETAGVLIPAEGPGALLIGPESETYARDRSKIGRLYLMTEYRESADPAYPGIPVSTFEEVIADLGLATPRKLGIGGYLVTTAQVLDGLRASFPDTELVRADNIMVKLRSVKSSAEIECIKRAFEISEKAVDAVLEIIHPGMTELEVVGTVQKVIYESGGEYEGMPQYVLSGKNSAHAISRPTHKKLESGELVQLNLSARVSGYSSGVGRPVCLGKMSPRMRELVEFGLEAHQQTIEWLKAGANAGEVAKRYKQLFVDRGYESNFLYGPCHGLGMIEVEPPWMEENSNYLLARNMTFQADTFVQAPDFGLRWEDGVRITDAGTELFSGRHHRLIELT